MSAAYLRGIYLRLAGVLALTVALALLTNAVLRHRTFATNRLYEAVEKGLLPMDSTLAARAQTLKGKRDSVLMELASVRRVKEVPAAALSAAHVEAFGAALRARLQEGPGSFPKRYLRQFVSDIRFDGKRLTMSGRTDAPLAAALEKKMGTARVPTSGLSWLPDLGSNQGPTD